MDQNTASNSQTVSSRSDRPPFGHQETLRKIVTSDGSILSPEIYANVDSGFFLSEDRDWTCYRRSYFSVSCAYSMPVDASQKTLFLAPPDPEGRGPRHQIHAMAMTLGAFQDGEPNKVISLIQHTPTRDKGPQLDLPIVKLWPTTDHSAPYKLSISNVVSISAQLLSEMSPHPPSQDVSEEGPDGSPSFSTHREKKPKTIHRFDRIQFASATANNGKRRRQQAYYCIVAVLMADVRSDNLDEAKWVKVAQRPTCRLVIRGRSPSHYPNEGPKLAPVQVNRNLPTRPILPAVHEAVPDAIAHGLHSVEQPTSKLGSEYTILDDSSVSSMQSDGGTSRQKSSISSVTSVGQVENASDRLAAFMFEFMDIRELAQACFVLDNSSRTERNIHRLMKILAAYLLTEASSPADLTVARTLKRYSKKVARSMRALAGVEKMDSQHLPLVDIPEFRDYSLQQFFSSSSALQRVGLDSAEHFAQLAVVPVVEELESPSQLGSSERNVAQRLENNFYTSGAHKREQSDSSDGNSEDGVADFSLGALGGDLERAKHFFRRSEALEEFREGLLDFREALKNSQHNRLAFENMQSEKTSHKGLEAAHTRPERLAMLFQKIAQRILTHRKPGYRRIRWKCECGASLQADFKTDNLPALERLETALSNTSDSPRGSNDATSSTSQPIIARPQTIRPTARSELIRNTSLAPNSKIPSAPQPTLNNGMNSDQVGTQPDPKYVATCVSTGGIYKTVTEIDVSQIKSDAEFFLAVKNIYQNIQQKRKRWTMFFKPMTVEFVQFTVWSPRQSYVSICDRPECIPPAQDAAYDFSPRPMAPLPPVPPEIFIHYLQHTLPDGEFSRLVWLPRLPKRVTMRMIDSPIPSYGWGVFIKEGLNKVFLFWAILAVSACSIILCIVWSTWRSDVQGGSGLGSLLLGLVPVGLGAIMLRFSDTS